MRFNEREVASVASQVGDKEGRLSYKSPGFYETYKERWFKLKGNLFFYFRLNEHGGVSETEPAGLLVIEQCRVQQENFSDLPFTFSITFAGDLDKKHYFGCRTQKHCDEWIKALQECSYEFQRDKLRSLQGKIIQLTGRDPLANFSASMLPPTVEKTDSDVFFTRVHPVSKDTEVSDDFSLI